MAIKLERVVKTYYDTLEEGKVLGRKCPKCGNVEWPPVYACNACGNYETEWYEMSGKGVLQSLVLPTVMSFKPALKDLEPYAYGAVQCEEGPVRNMLVKGITRKNAAYVRANMPYPVHMEIVQREGFKTAVFAIDPIEADGTPVVKEAAAPQSETLVKLLGMVAQIYKKDVATLTADTSFDTDLKAPSVTFVGLIANIEEEFDTLLSMQEASAAKTIGGLAELIEKEMGK